MSKFILLCLSLLSASLISCASPELDTVAVVGDLSGSSKALGHSIAFGARWADDKVSASRAQKRVRLRVDDDRGDPNEAAKIAFRLATDPNVLAVIGHSASGTTAPAEEMYGKYGLPLLMPVATNPDITANALSQNWHNTFRLVPTDDLQAFRIADFASRQLKATKPIVLHDRTRYGQTVGRSLTRAFREKQLEVPATMIVESFTPGLVLYTDLAKRIADFSPDLLVFAGYYQEGAALVQQLRATGNKLPFILTDGCFQTEFLTNIGPRPHNLYLAFVAPEWSRIPKAAELSSAFQKSPTGGDPTYAPFAADAYLLLTEAVHAFQEQNKKISRQMLIDILHQNTIPFDGIAGPYKFDNAGDNINGRNYMFTVVDDKGVYRFRQVD